MADNPPPFHPQGDQKLKASSRRQYRLSDDHSPTRGRVHDELLSQLTPMSAVDVLQYPTLGLKACLDAATANEQDFAMRTAMASQSIYEWMDELSEWPWPSRGGSAGFELPAAKRRKVSFGDESDDDEYEPITNGYLGSLPAEQVFQYEERVGDISQGLEDLDIDEIKTQILHNHILPLSRPGTPMSDSNRSIISIATFNRLDDLSAVMTAIVMQALPNLSKLRRLLHVWKVRLIVLRKMTTLLSAISEAELALKSGWNVVSPPRRATTEDHPTDETAPRGLSQTDFDVMRRVLVQKISRPAGHLDFMLDHLEGMPDTLPDAWLDRMEVVERGYADWHVACERKIQEAKWAATRPQKAASPALPTSTPADVPRVEGESEKERQPGTRVNITIDPPTEQATNISTTTRSTSQPRPDSQNPPQTPVKSKRLSAGPPEILSPPSTTEPMSHRTDLRTPASLHQRGFSYDGSEDVDPVKSDMPTPYTVPRTHDVMETPSNRRIVSEAADEDTVIVGDGNKSHAEATLTELSLSEDSDSEVPQTPESSDEEADLPPLINTRRSSSASVSSTILHGETSQLISSDLPEVSASPPLPREKFAKQPEQTLESSPVLVSVETPDIAIAQASASKEDESAQDLASSPPMEHSFREDSLGPAYDQSQFEDDSMFRSSGVFSSSFIEEDTENTSTIGDDKASDIVHEDQLQQQIHNILESIPAIKLAASPSKINLNPPPLELPFQRPKKPTRDPFRRSASGLSSRASTRASTPAWLLAPAYGKNPRPQRSRGQQETKVYHLSRSTGEAPIRLLIRCVGEHGERVMVRVGGGWADLGEYLKEYASHHGRRSQNADTAKIEVRDLPRVSGTRASTASPPARPVSALEYSPITPLQVRKTRKSFGASSIGEGSRPGIPGPPRPKAMPLPKTPAPLVEDNDNDTPPSDSSARSRSSSRLSWAEEDSSLGLAGPNARKVEMSEESRAWVESVKEKVRMASGERKPPTNDEGRFGELGKVGGTKRLFRKT